MREARDARFGEEDKAQSLTNRLSAQVCVLLHQVRLSDIVANELAPCPAVPPLMGVVDEQIGQGRRSSG